MYHAKRAAISVSFERDLAQHHCAYTDDYEDTRYSVLTLSYATAITCDDALVTTTVRQEHHCPYICNCIGALNQKHFLLFLLYMHIASIYALVLMSICYHKCESKHHCNRRHHTATVILATTLMIISVAGALNTAFMLFNQLQSIFIGAGTIDRLQLRRYRAAAHRRTQSPLLADQEVTVLKYEPVAFADVMGCGSMLRWLLPLDVQFESPQDRERVLGYVIGGGTTVATEPTTASDRGAAFG
jgi:DHHC palmitoyltransferase